MQLASSPVFYEPPLAAMPQLSEKPRQGFETWKMAWKPGPNVPNSTVAIGLRAGLALEGVRKTYRARYYNPATGRFLSEDPMGFAGGVNKYVYTHDDPIDRRDASGLLDVFIWQARDGFGHASVQLDDGTYISWWPSAEGRSPNKGGDSSEMKQNDYNAPAIPNRIFQQDVNGEDGYQPDYTIHIDGLDENAIRDWWSKYRSNPNNRWDTVSRNCSTTAYEALHAGGGFYDWQPMWSPYLVHGYALDVQLQMMMTQIAKSWVFF